MAAKAKLELVFAPELLKHVLGIFRDIGGNLNFTQVLFLIESVNSSTIYSRLCEKLVLNLFAGCESWFVVSHAGLGDFPRAIRSLRRVKCSFLES